MKIANYRLVLTLWMVVVSNVCSAVVVEDDLGNRVELDRPAKRIVTLAPHLVETMFAAGGGGQVVGTVSYSDFPEAAKAIPRVGSYKTINEEVLLALKPDLVVTWHSGNGPEMIRRLKSLGLTVYVSEPHRLQDIARSLKRMGLLSGHQAEGEAASRRFLQQLELLQIENGEQRPISVFYQVWDKPLQTLNGEHLISDVIRLCGGRNIYESAAVLAPQVNLEALLTADPEVIIASGMGEARPEWLDNWHNCPSLKAVRKNHLYFIPPDILQRHTPRILLGMRILCEHLKKARETTN